MAQSLMAGGSIGSLFLNLSLGSSVCVSVLYEGYGMEWDGMDWLCAVSVYSRFQKAACYGALYSGTCVCVCVSVDTVYKGGDREREGWGLRSEEKGAGKEKKGLQ